MAEPLARAAFAFSLDDRIDVACRIADALPTIHRQRRWVTAIGAALGSAAALALLRLNPGSDHPADWQPAGIFAGVVGAALLFVLPRTLARAHRRAIGKVVRGLHGEADGRCEVELHADQLAFTQDDMRITMPWSKVRSVVADRGDIVIRSEELCLVVNARAFASPAAAATFLDLAQRLRAIPAPPAAR